MFNRKEAIRLMAAACLAVPAIASHAQTAYPDKAIKMVVPYPAGGLLDGVARILAPRLRETMGQAIVIDNKGGGSGVIGTDQVAKSKADGYTLLFGGFGPNAVNASILASVPYDAAKDFSPVVEVFRTDHILVVGNSVAANTLSELTELARDPKTKLTVATAGTGSATHLFAELYRLAADVQLNVIPYRGDAPAITAMLGGEVQAYFASAISILPYLKAGRLKALAVTGKERLESLPNVPTLAQAGLPKYEATAWYGLYAPAGTPAAVIETLNKHVNAALQQAEVRKFLLSEGGVTIVGGSPEALQQKTNAEIAKWRAVVESAKLRTP